MRFPVQKWATDAGVLLAVLPGSLYLMGRTELQSYFGRLGLADPTALPASADLIARGFTVAILPAVVFALCYLGAVLVSRHAKTPAAAEVRPLSLFALLAASTWLTAAISFVGIGDNTSALVAGITVLDVVAITVGATLFVLILGSSVSDFVPMRLMMGKTLSGSILLATFLVGGLVVHAHSLGVDRGSDVAWRCKDSPGVVMQTEGNLVSPNQTYLFLAHANGSYFLRHPGLEGNVPEVIAVPESVVLKATHVPVPKGSDCNT